MIRVLPLMILLLVLAVPAFSSGASAGCSACACGVTMTGQAIETVTVAALPAAGVADIWYGFADPWSTGTAPLQQGESVGACAVGSSLYGCAPTGTALDTAPTPSAATCAVGDVLYGCAIPTG